MPVGRPTLTLGPVLFNWTVDVWEDFYARIADEADLDRVVVGEVVCSKRLPHYTDRIPSVVERLTRAGKAVAFGSLALVTTDRERRLSAELAEMDGVEIEVNDLTLLAHLAAGRDFAVGPFVSLQRAHPRLSRPSRCAARMPAAGASVQLGPGAVPRG